MIMKILAIDWGEKRWGLAFADTTVDVVLPFGILENKNEAETVKKIKELIKEKKIDQIVFGLPKGLDNSKNEKTEKIEKIAEDFKKIIRVSLIDERFTSAQADRCAGGCSRDEKAAMLILRAFLDKKDG